jgi:outer membrane protein TolC
MMTVPKRSIGVALLLMLLSVSIAAVTPQQLWERVEDTHKELRSADVKIRQSQFDLSRAQAERFPELKADITGSFMGNPMERIVIYPDDLGPGTELPQGSGSPIELYGGQESTLYQFNLTATQPIFTWGKISNSIKLQETLGRAAVIEREMKLNELETTFSIIIDNLWYVERMMELMELQLEVVRQLQDLAQESYTYGTVLKDELLEAQMRLRQVELGADQLEVQYGQLQLRLQQMTGDYRLRAGDIDYQVDIDLLMGVDADIYRSRERQLLFSDQHALKLQEYGAEARDIAARIAADSVYWKPDIAFRLDLGYSGPRFPFVEADWFGQGDYSLNATIAVTTTLWDGGTALIDKASAIYEADQSQPERVEVEQELVYTYRKTLLELSSAQQSVAYYRDKISSDEQAVDYRAQQRSSGSGTQAELLAARSRLYDDQLSYYQELSNLSRTYHTLQSLVK